MRSASGERTCNGARALTHANPAQGDTGEVFDYSLLAMTVTEGWLPRRHNGRWLIASKLWDTEPGQ